jgi:hypothetical protein
MAFGGRPFWRQPANRRDSNECRFRSARPSSAPTTGLLSGPITVCQLLLEFIFSLYLSLSTAAIGELQIKVLAGMTVPFGITTTPSRTQ